MSDIVNYYQTIPELGIYGRMNTPEEFEKIKLPKKMENWKVLDVGCNTGAFLLECFKRGADVLWGVEPNSDWRLIAKGVLFDIYDDTVDCRVVESIENVGQPMNYFDLVLLLSVTHLVEDPQNLVDIAWNHTNKLLILEVNDRLQDKDFTIPIDARRFVQVGKNKDNRSVYHLWK